MKRASIAKIKVWFDVPVTLKNDPQGDLHDEMINRLMDLPRCNEYLGGHWAYAIFEYDSFELLRGLKGKDAVVVQSVVDEFNAKTN